MVYILNHLAETAAQEVQFKCYQFEKIFQNIPVHIYIFDVHEQQLHVQFRAILTTYHTQSLQQQKDFPPKLPFCTLNVLLLKKHKFICNSENNCQNISFLSLRELQSSCLPTKRAILGEMSIFANIVKLALNCTCGCFSCESKDTDVHWNFLK
jgi:hypothetical protein